MFLDAVKRQSNDCVFKVTKGNWLPSGYFSCMM
jgi:hypothetical protein